MEINSCALLLAAIVLHVPLDECCRYKHREESRLPYPAEYFKRFNVLSGIRRDYCHARVSVHAGGSVNKEASQKAEIDLRKPYQCRVGSENERKDSWPKTRIESVDVYPDSILASGSSKIGATTKGEVFRFNRSTSGRLLFGEYRVIMIAVS